MRASTDLAKLYDAIQYRLIRIERVFASAPQRPVSDQTLAIGSAVIELDNLIVSGVREFLVSACFRARTVGRSRIEVSTRFTSEEQVSAYMLSVMNARSFQIKNSPLALPRRDEPTIRQPRDIRKILAGQQATNIGAVDRAMSLNATVFDDLPTLRNFYAHRNEDTWRKARAKARNLGLYAVQKPDDVPLGYAPGATSTLFAGWVSEAGVFFEELMK